MIIEICSDTLDVALNASKKADRIEWCSVLALGGLTPDPGLTKTLLKYINSVCEVHVMIRPRQGNFTYSNHEFEAMKDNLERFSKLGVHGVVYGFLNEQGELDTDRTKTFTVHALNLGLNTTFHRAIDVCKHPEEALVQLMEIGVNRVLTSGAAPTAKEGLGLIKVFIEKAQGKIEVMPGSGINPSNASLFKEAGCSSVHFSCHKKVEGNLFGFGDQYFFDQEKFDAIQSIIR